MAVPLATAALLGLGACAEREQGATGAQSGAVTQPEVAVVVPVEPAGQPGETTAAAGQQQPQPGAEYQFQIPEQPPEAAQQAADSARLPQSWEQASSGATAASGSAGSAAAPGEPSRTIDTAGLGEPAHGSQPSLAQDGAGGDMRVAQADQEPGASAGIADGAQPQADSLAQPDTRTLGAGPAAMGEPAMDDEPPMAADPLPRADRG